MAVFNGENIRDDSAVTWSGKHQVPAATPPRRGKEIGLRQIERSHPRPAPPGHRRRRRTARPPPRSVLLAAAPSRTRARHPGPAQQGHPHPGLNQGRSTSGSPTWPPGTRPSPKGSPTSRARPSRLKTPTMATSARRYPPGPARSGSRSCGRPSPRSRRPRRSSGGRWTAAPTGNSWPALSGCAFRRSRTASMPDSGWDSTGGVPGPVAEGRARGCPGEWMLPKGHGSADPGLGMNRAPDRLYLGVVGLPRFDGQG